MLVFPYYKFGTYRYFILYWWCFFKYNIVHCRKRTIFDDNPVEIQELTFIIKEDIANLNKQILQLQQVSTPLTLTGEKLSG